MLYQQASSLSYFDSVLQMLDFFAEPKKDLFLFYGKGRPGVIRGLDMNIKSSDEHMEPIVDLVNPRAIDYNAELGHIYFADTTSFLIGRQKLDGNGRETILKDGECRCSRNPFNITLYVRI